MRIDSSHTFNTISATELNLINSIYSKNHYICIPKYIPHTMLTANEIRAKFLEFFESKGHTIVPSAPIVIKNDPTLMFTNAGMNQFKEYFLEIKEAPYKSATDTQKCLRVNGKHNDLEEVGVDTYHHTMFEMLGNWSFGSYFKEEAIAWSWELLTEVYKMNPENLYVTVFEGDEGQGIPKDEESFEIWKKYIAEDRILMGNRDDNFWEMGEMGPCGPSTEIHVDCRTEEEKKDYEGYKLVNQDHPQVIEIWNNVFIQYDRKKDGSLEALKGKYVDTGMGLERLVRVLQNKQSNYDTDLFSECIGEIEKLTGIEYKGTEAKSDIAIRVLADHIRAIVFTICDGQIPSNTGAGYVIRRILRRAVRYYYSELDRTEPLLYLLVAGLAERYVDVFPEVKQQHKMIEDIVREEEEAFLRTLEKGLKKIDEIVGAEPSDTISGKSAFELYDTFGFPLDLTKLIVADSNKLIDEKGFEIEMQEQKKRSRNATALETDDWIVIRDEKESVFVGYDSLQSVSNITRYRSVEDAKNRFYQFVMNATPFYPEGGGQIGDQGLVSIADKKLRVFDTKKENNQIIHFTKDDPAELASENLETHVNKNRRKATECNHTATHLLHEALREILGKHVEQKGSLVSEKILRFDFSHFQKVTNDELNQIEARVMQMIQEAHPVTTEYMTKEEADKKGAMALFGEKYGDEVRVVTVDDTPSVELCGGTHVRNTSEIQFFKIISESSVAAGVRRVEALTSKVCIDYIGKQLDTLDKINEIIPSKNLVVAVEKLQSDNHALMKEVEKLKQKMLSSVSKELKKEVDQNVSPAYLVKRMDGYNVDDLKKIAFSLREGLENYLFVLTSENEGKYNVVLLLDEATQSQKAWDVSAFLKQELAPKMKGGGGGQKTLASGAGKVAISQSDILSVTQNYFK